MFVYFSCLEVDLYPEYGLVILSLEAQDTVINGHLPPFLFSYQKLINIRKAKPARNTQNKCH